MEENESIRIDEGKRKIVGYQVRATELFKNGEELAMKGELEKAGEFFWGAISCYLNALEFLDKGKAHGGHGEMVKMAKKIAGGVGNAQLLEAIKSAEKFHSNYYHSNIPEDEFPEYHEKARYAFQEFGEILKDELLRRGIASSPDS